MIAVPAGIAGFALAGVVFAGAAAADGPDAGASAKVHDSAHRTVAQTAQAGKSDIVQTAMKAGKFKTLIAALKAAGMVEALKGKGPYTVFAPSDAAFAKLPQGTVQMLLKPENKAKLKALLAAHVLPELIVSKDWQGRSGRFDTFDGGVLSLVAAEKVTVDAKATVIMSDIGASNGVIHVIDTVLTPVRD